MHPLRGLSADTKRKLRARYRQYRQRLVDVFFAYGPDQLLACLQTLGVNKGDCILLHSGFELSCGFRASIDALIDTFVGVAGDAGNLLMVSLPYRSSSYEYLTHLTCFDVRRAPSQMGLISEVFRRREGVLRSVHPTHPVLACGPKAEWIVSDHEKCVFPCGPGTPFEKLLTLDGKVLFFNVPFSNFTFVHYLEHLVHDQLPFPLYDERVFKVPVVDCEGKAHTVITQVFSSEAIRRRRFGILEQELRRHRLIQRRRVGNTQILMIRVKDAVECVLDMSRRGKFFYDTSDCPPNQSVRSQTFRD